MTTRFATHREVNEWNLNVMNNPSGYSIFNSLEFAKQKDSGAYKARFIIINEIAVTVLEQKTIALGKFWYIPKGPNVTSARELQLILDDLKIFAKKNGVFAVRIEPELDKNEEHLLGQSGLIKTMSVLPNSSTIVVDIKDDLDSIMAKLPQKGRYAINRAQREGVIVKKVKLTEKNCMIMYNLLIETSRNKFDIRSYEYYQSFWERFDSSGYGQLFFAYYNQQVVAGAYAISYGDKAMYKDGASVCKKNVYGACHLLQWSIIKWAKSRNASVYDLCGTPPSKDLKNVNHKFYYLGMFKTAFNKNVTDYVGCYDLGIKPIQHSLWINLGEKLSHRWHYYMQDSYY